MDEDLQTFKGFMAGTVLFGFITLSIGLVELYSYNISDVTRGKPFELDDKIYKCSELKFD